MEPVGCPLQVRSPEGENASFGRPVDGGHCGKLGQQAGEFAARNDTLSLEDRREKGDPVGLGSHDGFRVEFKRRGADRTRSAIDEPAKASKQSPGHVIARVPPTARAGTVEHAGTLVTTPHVFPAPVARIQGLVFRGPPDLAGDPVFDRTCGPGSVFKPPAARPVWYRRAGKAPPPIDIHLVETNLPNRPPVGFPETVDAIRSIAAPEKSGSAP